MQTNTYLFFDGNCREAFEFYAATLGGDLKAMITGADTPMAEEMPAMRDKIMHAYLQIGDTAIMASDAPAPHYNKPQGFDVCIYTDTLEEAERIFAALSEGGEVTMPLEKTFWAERFGSLVDRFGTPWMINYTGDNAFKP
ncbi:MAG: VOC family protein [Gammaproteobacteria bacterium]|nr:VOC family protein [Gammaproteobacteria bacterium]